MQAISIIFWQQLAKLWHCQRIGITVIWLLFERVFNVSKMHENKGICQRFCHSLAKEFQCEKILLSHEPSDVFCKSQWQSQSKSLLWLIYRWIFAALFSAGVLSNVIQTFRNGIWFIYLTDWGFILCMYTSIFGAVLVTIYYCRSGKNEVAVSLWALKLYWASYWTTLVLATVITTVYWIFIFPNDHLSAWGIHNLWAHGFNSIMMIFDHMLVAFPSHILHYVYPFGLGLIYLIFSVIYYYAGGVDPFGNRFIYEILDWSKPGTATLTFIGALVLTFVFSCIHFGLYKLRTFIYRQRRSPKITLNV
ncbi:protein rolling stone-like isoform X2 [Anastrepha obliqua]|uniref:protein rolling stone-like isoform X2 n=2 Tax=Anastrepha obliqua TaxID=95512 RepID=UPI0024092094|nr:protein rolling stone-like isoform X2 [Anastrepha obliqua]